ncbi:ankyrin repeat-containing domain protein [Xylaria sp. FL0933]|nr:ankyrin repeat-containing domain protein [Xylaria sp. FL0933]
MQHTTKFIEHQEALLLNKFFNEMVSSDNPLAAFVAQALSISSTPIQRPSIEHPIAWAARAKTNHFWENGDVSTALAMQEIALLHELERTPLTCTSMVLKYCDIYLETTKRLTTISGREVPALPPLHYLLHLMKKTESISPFTVIFSRFASAKDYLGRSSLHVALDLGMTRCADNLIQAGVTGATDKWDRHPIHVACSQTSEALVKRVLEITVDYDVEDALGHSALHYASFYGNEGIIQLLLERGVNVHHKDDDGQVPISWAVRNGHTAAVQLLLKSGADARSRCRKESLLIIAASQGHAGIVKALLDNGARPFGQPALWRAAGAGHTGTVELLLRYGATIDGASFKGETALIYASEKGHANVVRALLKNGTSIDGKNIYGETALIYSSRNGHANVVEALLKKGASTNEETVYGDTAFSYARGNGHVDVVELLLKHGADSTVLSQGGGKEIVLAHGKNYHQYTTLSKGGSLLERLF